MHHSSLSLGTSNLLFSRCQVAGDDAIGDNANGQQQRGFLPLSATILFAISL